jgi:hypothetical protein
MTARTVPSRLTTALRAAEERAAPRLRDLVRRLRENARLESPRRRARWVAIALLLVLVPTLFNAAREGRTAASLELFPSDVGPYPAVRDTTYYAGLLADPELVTQMRLNARAEPAAYSRAQFRLTPRGTVMVTVHAEGSAQTTQLVNALGPQLAGATKRRVAQLAKHDATTLRARIHSGAVRAPARRKLRRRLRETERVVANPAARISLGASAPPRALGWADRLADALPGGRPPRANPVAAALAGLLIAATLWCIGLIVVPPSLVPSAGRRRTRVLGIESAASARWRVGVLDGWRGLVWLGALAVWPILTLRSIVANGVNVPFWDQWTMVSVFQAQDRGVLSFNDFWTQANEHRPLFPRAINFLLAQITSWDIRAELYVNFAVALVTFVVVLIALRRTLTDLTFAIASVVASVIFFSPVQWENWLWGFELEFFMCSLAAVGTMLGLTFVWERSRRAGMGVAVASALVGSYSFANGLLLWPVALALLLLRRRPWRMWVALGVVTWFLYLNGWYSPGGPSKTLFLERPFEYAQFVCLYVGRWFAVNTATGTLAGAALILSFVAGATYVIRERRDTELLERTSFWLGLGLFVLTTSLVTGVSRLGLGLLAASVSRYSVFSGLFAISTMVLLLAIARSERVAGRVFTERTRRAAIALVTLPLLLAALVNTRSSSREMDRWGVEKSAYAACVHGAKSAADPCLKQPDVAAPTLQFDRIRFLRSKGLAGF